LEIGLYWIGGSYNSLTCSTDPLDSLSSFIWTNKNLIYETAGILSATQEMKNRIYLLSLHKQQKKTPERK